MDRGVRRPQKSRLGVRRRLKTRVLLVDDDTVVLRVTARRLSSLGCSVTTASGVEAALEEVRAPLGLDVVLTDYRLCDATGAELVDRLGRRVPVVLFTGDVDAVPREHRSKFVAVYSKLDPITDLGAYLLQFSRHE